MARSKGSSTFTRRGFLGSAFAGAAVTMLPGQLSGKDAPCAVEDAGAIGRDKQRQDKVPTVNTPDHTLIGNIHALLPGAVAFIRNGEAGIVLDIGSDSTGRPGSTAPDFS